MGQDRESAEEGLVVDLSTKKLVISAMQILIRRLLIFFVLAVYTVIPFSDSIACDECISRVPFQEGREISYKNLPQVDISTSINAADTHDRPSSESDGKSLCSICFNSVEGIEIEGEAKSLLYCFSNTTCPPRIAFSTWISLIL